MDETTRNIERTELVSRPRWLNEALLFRDTNVIKVITGVRRCGKSSLLELIRRAIESDCAEGSGFAYLNLESKKCSVTSPEELYSFFTEQASTKGRTYIFIDEPQRIKGWEDAVNALRVDLDCDIYLTGSNAYLLSGELATYLSGRYVEVKMLPLAFSEYLDFCSISFSEDSSAAMGPDGAPIAFGDVFRRWLEYGGMPAIATPSVTQAMHSAYMSSLYNTIATRDILNRERVAGGRKVTDPILLSKLTAFLADNIGNTLSANSVASALTTAGTKTTNKTVDSYITALNEAYLFYPASRYDIHGKAVLKTLPKQYVCDLGLRSYIMGYRASDVGRAFENTVYLQLLFLGYSVHVGKLYNVEVDFVAKKDGRVIYLQATDEMYASETREREIKPLLSIRDAHEKAIVVRQGEYPRDINGVRVLTAQEFFVHFAL